VTIDAMGRQRAIAQKMIEKNGEYILDECDAKSPPGTTKPSRAPSA